VSAFVAALPSWAGSGGRVVLIADFDAPIERVWELWADPRQLERWGAFEVFPQSVGQMDALLAAS
jgi:uncharacterized protein YndB with AHSA1/START domain